MADEKVDVCKERMIEMMKDPEFAKKMKEMMKESKCMEKMGEMIKECGCCCSPTEGKEKEGAKA